MRALIVDDSKAMRSILRKILLEIGFEVGEAGNGIEALRALESTARTDLALVDWTMPEMDGIEFVRRVRATQAYGHLQLMMVTSESESGKVEMALTAGANEYVMKPFTRQILVDKLALLGFHPAAAETAGVR